MSTAAVASSITWPDAAREQAFAQWLNAIAPRHALRPASLRSASTDASFRRYLRIDGDHGLSRIVMDAPPPLSDVRPFMAVAALLHGAALHAPQVLEADVAHGFLLLTDLGSTPYLDALTEAVARGDPKVADTLMRDAIAALVQWQQRIDAALLPVYDEAFVRRELQIFPEWCVEREHGVVWTAEQQATWAHACNLLVTNALAQPTVAMHRDYMPRNLMVASPNPGILDFQDAVRGPISYDLASLLRDAFISWDEEQELDWAVRYWEAARKAELPVPADFGEFWTELEWMGLQRHLKVLGIFCRLKHRDGKPHYIADLPRFYRYAHKVADRYNALRPLARLLEPLMGLQRIEGFTSLMLRITELRLPLDHPDDALRAAIVTRLAVPSAALKSFTVFKRGVDARKKSAIVLTYTLDCEVDDETSLLQTHAADPRIRATPDTGYHFIGHAPADFAASARPRPVVVGFGPCGIFAALVLAQMGLQPIVLERGKAVRERTQDTWGLWRRGELQPESNVQFGEGGAGTFSDGKLWSQISDPRHLTRKVLAEFVKAGAPEEILFVSKPHIGTFRLVGMVEKMRAEIESLGGEVRFGERVADVLIEAGHIRGLTLASGEQLAADHVVLALGHSARDTFAMLHERGVYMEAKPFSIGFRVEHPQGLIDAARYGPNAGHPLLGAADYKLVHHARNGRSVYSFCMCPGGTVVAATSEPERVVTNGMSQYSRNERNANAGIVVGIDPADYARDPNASGPVNPLDGIAFQRRWESRAFALGEGGYRAPGQLVGDFIKGRRSSAFGDVQPSYKPGVTLTDLGAKGNESLPSYAIEAIREALPAFERQIRGFSRADAVLTGVETRTSSPLRITRGRNFQSLNVRGLFPAGEGAGYAGGIMSAGVDGIEVAEALGRAMLGLPEPG